LWVGLAVFALLKLPSDTSQVGLTATFSSKLNALGVTANDVGRLDRLRVAASALFATNAIGLGTGGFAAEYASVSGTQNELAASDGRDFPHNIFFELAAELGLVGLILALAWVVVSVKGLARVVRPGAPEATLLVALWVYALVNACVSGDVVSNAAVLVFGALPWLVAGSPVVRSRPSTAGTPNRAGALMEIP
jgi:O-antigen ligase